MITCRHVVTKLRALPPMLEGNGRPLPLLSNVAAVAGPPGKGVKPVSSSYTMAPTPHTSTAVPYASTTLSLLSAGVRLSGHTNTSCGATQSAPAAARRDDVGRPTPVTRARPTQYQGMAGRTGKRLTRCAPLSGLRCAWTVRGGACQPAALADAGAHRSHVVARAGARDGALLRQAQRHAKVAHLEPPVGREKQVVLRAVPHRHGSHVRLSGPRGRWAPSWGVILPRAGAQRPQPLVPHSLTGLRSR
jgi:hypothetical protein